MRNLPVDNNQSLTALDDQWGSSLKLSIIIATFRRPRQLESCLQALTTSRCERDSFEVIIVNDGGPEDELRPCLRVFENRFSIRLISQANSGPGTARNKGAAIAAADYLYFIDDDCLVEPDTLIAASAAVSNVRRAMIGGAILNRYPNNIYCTASQLITDLVYSYYNRDHARSRFFASNNMIVPKAQFLEVGGFDPAFRIAAEDRDFCRRWREAGYSMVFADSVQLVHGREQTLHSFLRQHFNYGRGAHAFHAQSREGLPALLERPFSFYRFIWPEVVNVLRNTTLRHRAQLIALLIICRVADAAGFFYQSLHKGK
jgi:GT2 family glycosyltransferase